MHRLISFLNSAAFLFIAAAGVGFLVNMGNNGGSDSSCFVFFVTTADACFPVTIVNKITHMFFMLPILFFVAARAYFCVDVVENNRPQASSSG